MTSSGEFEPQIEQLNDMLLEQGIAVDKPQVELLDLYRRQLWTWNQRMNLTRHTTLEKFISRDVVDSWHLCQLLDRGERVLDVGTGGGVPGLVMAILRPDLSVDVCESTKKKAEAVQAMVADLGLPIDAHICRAEEVLEINTYGTLVARAVAPLSKVLTWLRDSWSAFDVLLLIKGRTWINERHEARQQGLLRELELRKAASYQTPGTGAESVILKLWHAAADP